MPRKREAGLLRFAGVIALVALLPGQAAAAWLSPASNALSAAPNLLPLAVRLPEDDSPRPPLIPEIFADSSCQLRLLCLHPLHPVGTF